MPVSVVGARGGDRNGGDVGDDPVIWVDGGAGRSVGDDTDSRVSGGSGDVVGEGVYTEATGGTCGSDSGHTCSEVDDCID